MDYEETKFFFVKHNEYYSRKTHVLTAKLWRLVDSFEGTTDLEQPEQNMERDERRDCSHFLLKVRQIL